MCEKGLVTQYFINHLFRNGHYLVAVLLIEALPSVINCRDEGGRTALHLSAMNGHTATVKELIERGADINSKSGTNYNLLLINSIFALFILLYSLFYIDVILLIEMKEVGLHSITLQVKDIPM